MLDDIRPYQLHFVQKESPKLGDKFDAAFIYRFYVESNRYQRLKYILRVEQYEDVFAIKFYVARDRGLDERYNRILRVYGYYETMRIFKTCASVVPCLLTRFKKASFVVNGARSIDNLGREEAREETQRFKIYRTLAMNLFGENTFCHVAYPEISCYLLLNRDSYTNLKEKEGEMKDLFASRDFDL